MKKITIMAFASILMIAGCSSGGSSSNKELDTTSTNSVLVQSLEETNDDIIVTKENYRDFPVSNEENFAFILKDGEYWIESCNSKDKVIVVPEKVKGTIVVGLLEQSMGLLDCEAIVLPDSIKTIDSGAFVSDEKMKYIYLGQSLETIGAQAFTGCTSLSEIYFPKTMKNIELCTPANGKNITDIYIPAGADNITSLGFKEGLPNMVVHTPSGSVAEQMAIEAGFEVKNDYE